MNKKDFKFKMNKKMLIGIIAIVVVIIIVVVASILLSKNNDDVAKNEDEGISAITKQEIIKDETYEGLEFTNTTLIKDGNMYTMSIDVTNPTDQEIDVKQVDINFKNDKGSTIISLLGYLGEPMAAGETRTITSSTTVDLSKATSKTIEASTKD